MKSLIAETFLEVADALETGEYGKKPVIGVAMAGSEHGREDILRGIKTATDRGFKAVLIEGEDAHKQMEQKLAAGEIDGAVTMHYPFPIGVSTVGKVITPGTGKPMYIATTTGTSDTERVPGMIKNAIYGVIAAKADGVEHPTVGIANIDGARQTEKGLRALQEKGYDFTFADSLRADGGLVMRGNDLLAGTPDVMVMDSLTGNLMMKIFSAYTTGGNYESVGYGYGPGIGEGYESLVLIISRASGAPVIAGAIEYASNLLKNKWTKIQAEEFASAHKAGLTDVLNQAKPVKKEATEQAEMPAKEAVTSQIPGIEVMDLEDAVQVLWKANIYAESGMGCTGPVVLMSDANLAKSQDLLKKAGYIG